MNRAFTLIELIIVVAILLIAAAILFPVFARRNPSGHGRASCQSNLKQIGLGFMQYVQDYNERFPPTRPTSTTGWADAIYPYIKTQQLFQCSSAPSVSSTFTSDYFYNSRLSRFSQQKVSDLALTILSGDGDDNAPTWSSLAQIPSDATTNSSSPAQRHLGYGNYGFADGHVKGLKPQQFFNAAKTLMPKFPPR